MKFTELAKQVRMQVWADEYTLTNDTLATLYNAEVDAYAHIGVIANINEHWLGGIREVVLKKWEIEVEIPSEIIRIHRVELCIWWDWVVWQLYNLNRVLTLDDAELVSVSMEGRADGYAIFGRKIYVLSSDEVEKVKIYAQMYPDFIDKNIFNDDNATIEKPWNNIVWLPRIWHRLLKNRMAIAWKESRDKPIPLSTYERDMAGDLQVAMKVAGVVSTQRIYRMRKHRLEDVYEDSKSTLDNTERLLVDGDGVYLVI